jgi:hypothetical protein
MTAAFFRISSEAQLHTASRSAFTAFHSRAGSSSRGRPWPGDGGNPPCAASRACCIHRRSTLSFTPKSKAIGLIGFSRFKASAAASALNSFVYVRCSLSFFPICFSFLFVFHAYFSVYQMG